MIVHKNWVWYFVGGNLSKSPVLFIFYVHGISYVTCMPNGRIIL